MDIDSNTVEEVFSFVDINISRLNLLKKTLWLSNLTTTIILSILLIYLLVNDTDLSILLILILILLILIPFIITIIFENARKKGKELYNQTTVDLEDFLRENRQQFEKEGWWNKLRKLLQLTEYSFVIKFCMYLNVALWCCSVFINCN